MKEQKRKIETSVLVLLSIAAALALAILAGTIWSRYTTRKAAQEEAKALLESSKSFLDVGTIRVQLSPEAGSETGAVLIVKASIPYPLADSQFQEELIRKLPEIRDAIRGFFSLYTLSELQGTAEQELKMRLLERLGHILVLGKLNEIFFEEFIFFE